MRKKSMNVELKNRFIGLMPCFCRSRARTNGATQTFRRPSQATNLSHQRENSQSNTTNAPSNTGVYVPPHLNSNYQSSYSRNGASAESRYSKDQLLDLFRAQSKSGPLNTGLQDLFVDGWHPGATNGNSNGGWGKKEDHKEVSTGPDICWDHEGKSHPLALVEMEDHEKEVRRVLLSNRSMEFLLMRQLGFRCFCQFAIKTANTEFQ